MTYLNALLPMTGVDPFMVTGGSVAINANTIVTAAGSAIDLSGGSLHYQDGFIRDTILIDPSGKRVPIEQAKAGVPYKSVLGDFVVSHSRWGVSEVYSTSFVGVAPQFVAGYVQGAAAGQLSLATSPTIDHTQRDQPPDPSTVGAIRILDGQVIASTIAGPNQRLQNTGSTDPTEVWREVPAGASLVLTQAGDVTIASAGGALLPAGYQPGDPLPASLIDQHLLPASWFDGHTFQQLSITSGVDPDQPDATANVNRAPAGTLTVPAGAWTAFLTTLR